MARGARCRAASRSSFLRVSGLPVSATRASSSCSLALFVEPASAKREEVQPIASFTSHGIREKDTECSSTASPHKSMQSIGQETTGTRSSDSLPKKSVSSIRMGPYPEGLLGWSFLPVLTDLRSGFLFLWVTGLFTNQVISQTSGPSRTTTSRPSMSLPPSEDKQVPGEHPITLNFRTGSPVVSQVCTECWLRKPSNQFSDTSDVCSDCLDL